jgi:AraC-like DNA-binding protein
MLRIIFLLAPVFVSLFWFVALMGDKKRYGKPRLFLSWFMLLTSLIFGAHFLYFTPLPNLYIYFDLPLQFLGLAIFPIYHIYFRLLTVDEKFSVKAHAGYLIIPIVIVMVYGTGVFFTPVDEYKAWLFNQTGNQITPNVRFLSIMRTIMRITFLITLILSLTGNYLLIRKYGDKAEQFYSDIQDAKQKNAKNINHVIIAAGIISVIVISIGRATLMPSNWIIYIGWTIFAVLLFMIGNSGIRQKIINPSVDPENSDRDSVPLLKTSIKDQENFLNKIMEEFTNNKVYLNSELNIMDVVKSVGTNRTYISSIINKQSNQNFCSFVNSFRIEELERAIINHPGYKNEEFAHRCGFGSINSLKRAVYAKTGVSIQDFKQQILKRQPVMETKS